jgi:predicted Ser/Thr protein kinase
MFQKEIQSRVMQVEVTYFLSLSREEQVFIILCVENPSYKLTRILLYKMSFQKNYLL